MNNQRKLLQKLTKLAAENPKLDIIYVVDPELSIDDGVMAWGQAYRVEVDDYTLLCDGFSGDVRYYVKGGEDRDDLAEVMNYDYNGQDLSKLNDTELEEWFNNLPWTKAILVYIEPKE